MLLRTLNQLWNSPTFTTWGKQAADALRLFAVTPLILTQFDTTEIAAWYLFGSLMFFGQIIQGGIGLTFSRMIAFGMGGASDLAPIEDGGRKQRGTGTPNWEVIGRAYGTIGALNILLAVFVGVLAVAIGYYGLERMVGVHSRPAEIWTAFGIIVASQSFIFAFRKYEVTLRGMNYVVLINRWGTLFSILSVVAGFTVLTLGANIWQLALTMQCVLLLDIVRMRILLHHVEGGRAREFPAHRANREVLSWAWTPFWRVLVTNLSQEGVVQFALVVFARHGEPAVVASFLFSYRILRVIGRISNAPFSSHMPRMSRLLAEEKIEELRSVIIRQIFRSQALLAFGIIVGGLALSFLLPTIGSHINFLPLNYWFALGVVFVTYRFLVTTRAVFNLGNAFPFLKLEIVAGCIGFVLVLALVKTGSLWAVILCPLLPSILLMNYRVVNLCSRRLNITAKDYFKQTAAFVYILYSGVYIAFLLLKP